MASAIDLNEDLAARVEKIVLDEFELAGASWVTVAKLRDGAGWHLDWHDGVVNGWTFQHPLLSVVLARLATLARCGETDFGGCFATSDDEFIDGAMRFLGEHVHPPALYTSTDGRVVTWHGGPAKPMIEREDGESNAEWLPWRLWIPPTSIWCYEGGLIHGDILSPWGDTYHPSHAAACEFLGQAIVEGKVPA